MSHFNNALTSEATSNQLSYSAVWKEVHQTLGELGFDRHEVKTICYCFAQELECPHSDIFFELNRSGLDIGPNELIQIKGLLHNLRCVLFYNEIMN